MTDPDLDKAYALQTPDDNRKLYADWAASYDSGFAADMDYQLPRLVALVLAEIYQGAGPVLDLGAGTGLVADHMLMRGTFDIDALDISPQMLETAAAKGHYRQTIAADLTKPLDIADATYDAVVSAGTFTHGHVGPDALDEVIRIARPGALFVLTINAEHFEARGFAAKFRALAPMVAELEHREVNIYGSKAAAPHRDDRAQIAIFRKR
ncbi:biotin biosynthesis protein BioC [Sulfitobacter sp. THAF37]|uniref:class I SAM-dependent DNA methyltransferase n=1 Tax=Sulfitobacter sp. THAF37 TaxID=2587855 RepID=UPI0012696ABE|nr:class I SAM-dependent methyltransferase [Sulfitobacter sp. THAF37]QFT58069.1 biotin biosynthesis protein BioC [Sulfitobacter sp. THAF37]